MCRQIKYQHICRTFSKLPSKDLLSDSHCSLGPLEPCPDFQVESRTCLKGAIAVVIKASSDPCSECKIQRKSVATPQTQAEEVPKRRKGEHRNPRKSKGGPKGYVPVPDHERKRRRPGAAIEPTAEDVTKIAKQQAEKYKRQHGSKDHDSTPARPERRSHAQPLSSMESGQDVQFDSAALSSCPMVDTTGSNDGSPLSLSSGGRRPHRINQSEQRSARLPYDSPSDATHRAPLAQRRYQIPSNLSRYSSNLPNQGYQLPNTAGARNQSQYGQTTLSLQSQAPQYFQNPSPQSTVVEHQNPQQPNPDPGTRVLNASQAPQYQAYDSNTHSLNQSQPRQTQNRRAPIQQPVCNLGSYVGQQSGRSGFANAESSSEPFDWSSLFPELYGKPFT